MLSLKKWLILLLSIFSTQLAFSSEEVSFNLNYSKEDFSFGSTLLNIFTDLSKDKLEKRDVNLLLSQQDKTKIFSINKENLDRMKSITEIHDQDTFYKNCEIKPRSLSVSTESISERIDLSLDTYCRFLYLKRLSSLSSSINLSTRDLNYFREASPFFISGENTIPLTTYLKHFKANASEHEKLSSILIDKVLELKLRPPSAIMTNLRVNSKLNQFLQGTINMDDNSSTYFQEEFQKTIREAQGAIEKNDFGLAKQLSTGALRFFNQNKSFISDKRAFIGFIICAKAFYYKGKTKEAEEIFDQARLIASKEDYSEASFYLIWPYIVEKDYKGMRQAVEKHNLDRDFDKFDSKLQYWIAISESKNGKGPKSIEMFNRIITNSPYSFYSIMSLKELAFSSKSKASEEEFLAKLVSRGSLSDFPVGKFNSKLSDSLKRFAVWAKIGNERFQTLEIRYIQNLPKEDTFNDYTVIKNATIQTHKEFITLNLVKLLNSKKRYITSFKVFQDSIEQNSLSLNLKLMRYIFPLSYFDIVKKNAYTLDPLIVISLIRQESAFNPEANSTVGAKGLMQLMPATAKRFNNKIKIKNLGNPEINVAIGTKYLRLLLTRFDGNLIYALASYNAGENRIDRWRKDIFKNDDPLSTIESIPYEETRNYVKLIYRNYFFYKLIDNKSILKTPLEESLQINEAIKTI